MLLSRVVSPRTAPAPALGTAVVLALLPLPAWSAACTVPPATMCASMVDGFGDSELSVPENRAPIFAECSRERTRRVRCAAITTGPLRFQNLREVVRSDEILASAASLMDHDADAQRFTFEARRIARELHGSPFAKGDDWLARMEHFDEPQPSSSVPWIREAIGALSAAFIVVVLRMRWSARHRGR